MRKILSVVAALTIVISLSACSTDKGYTNISNDELQEMIDSDEVYQFVDVRTTTEYYDEHIEAFTRNINFYALEDDYSLLDNLDKSIPVVLMCNSGNRSAEAAKILVEQGFTEVYNLENGIQGWNGETV